MFSMQPGVVPFELKFQWFLVTMFIMTFAISATHWLMKKWPLWDEFPGDKLNKVAETHQTEANRDPESRAKVNVAPSTNRSRSGIDLESGAMELRSLGTKVLEKGTKHQCDDDN
jgi:hypothetical protein